MSGEHTRRGLRRSHVFWLVLALLAVLVLSAAASDAADAQKKKNRGGGDGFREFVVGPPAELPESVVYDEQTRAFYGASSLDGTVYKATLKDRTAEEFLPPGEDGDGTPDLRNQAQGVNVDDEGRLYVAGGTNGFLFVYDIKSRNLIARFDTNGVVDEDPGVPPNLADTRPPFINDVEIAPNGDVYFTDSNRPFIFRVTEAEIEAPTMETPPTTPETRAAEAIRLNPEVDYDPLSGRTDNPLEANGIRFTPDGEFIMFNSLNNGELYRLTPSAEDTNGDSVIEGREREILTVTELTPAQLGNNDGLEFLNSRVLFSVDNSGLATETPGSFDESPERLVTLLLSEDYSSGRVLSSFTSEEFRTPTDVTLAPGCLLLNQAEFFDTNGPPFVVLGLGSGCDQEAVKKDKKKNKKKKNR